MAARIEATPLKPATLEAFRQALAIELEALRAFAAGDHPDLEAAVRLLAACTGKVVFTGVGKCGYVCSKLAATFTSVGIPAVFLHPAEAIHGDLGIVQPGDVAVVLSNSGETQEITTVLPHLQAAGVPLIAFTGRPESTLARASDAVLVTRVAREADPLDTAPTASTTVMLAAGDALAAAAMQERGFTKADYGRFHPGGSLGQRLLCKVDTIMHADAGLPVVSPDTPVREVIFEITSKRLGAAIVAGPDRSLLGYITDGDLRRLFAAHQHPLELPASDIMTQAPKATRCGVLAVDALRQMEAVTITSLPVLDEQGCVAGLVHMHDIIKLGISV